MPTCMLECVTYANRLSLIFSPFLEIFFNEKGIHKILLSNELSISHTFHSTHTAFQNRKVIPIPTSSSFSHGQPFYIYSNSNSGVVVALVQIYIFYGKCAQCSTSASHHHRLFTRIWPYISFLWCLQTQNCVFLSLFLLQWIYRHYTLITMKGNDRKFFLYQPKIKGIGSKTSPKSRTFFHSS